MGKGKWVAAALAIVLWSCGVPSPPNVAELEERASGGDREAVEALVQRLGRDFTREQRTETYRALLRTPPGGGAPILDACRDPDPLRREHALALATHLKLPGAFPAAVEALADTSFPRRYVAAWALGEVGGEASVAPLLAALGREGGEVARAAARSLTKVGVPAVPALLDVLPELEPEGAGYVIRVLGDIGDRRAEAALRTSLGDPNLRADAAWALGKLGRSEAGAALLAHIRDPSWRTRLEVVRALGVLQTAAAESELDDLREADPVPAVREWAARSLALLRGTSQTYLTAAGTWEVPDSLYR